MKLHPRYQLVARARNKLSEFVLEQSTELDLTPAEMLGNLLTVAQEQHRFVLRMERHGDEDKKADEE